MIDTSPAAPASRLLAAVGETRPAAGRQAGQGADEPSSATADDGAYRPGDPADFDRLYRNSYSRVRATLVGLLRDQADADDCAQEAFVRAFRSWAGWRPEAPAEAWLHRIAINVAISHRRRHRVVGMLHDLFRAPDGGGLETVAERGDLLDALRDLPPRQAVAIVLRHLHGYSNREIGEALGVPERTVASRLAAARERLARRLAGDAELGTANGYSGTRARSDR